MTIEKINKRRVCAYLPKKRISGPVTVLFMVLLLRSYLAREAYT